MKCVCTQEWSIVVLVRWEYVHQKLCAAECIKFGSGWCKIWLRGEIRNWSNFGKSDRCEHAVPAEAALPGAHILTDVHPTNAGLPHPTPSHSVIDSSLWDSQCFVSALFAVVGVWRGYLFLRFALWSAGSFFARLLVFQCPTFVLSLCCALVWFCQSQCCGRNFAIHFD